MIGHPGLFGATPKAVAASCGIRPAANTRLGLTSDLTVVCWESRKTHGLMRPSPASNWCPVIPLPNARCYELRFRLLFRRPLMRRERLLQDGKLLFKLIDCFGCTRHFAGLRSIEMVIPSES